jgi:hypothetical protein
MISIFLVNGGWMNVIQENRFEFFNQTDRGPFKVSESWRQSNLGNKMELARSCWLATRGRKTFCGSICCVSGGGRASGGRKFIVFADLRRASSAEFETKRS